MQDALRVMNEVWIGPRRAYGIRKPPLILKKSKIKGGGVRIPKDKKTELHSKVCLWSR